jgi:hypothetical protein
MSYTDMTKPNPAWTPDQLHVYRERLAICGENRDQDGKQSNTMADYVMAYKQAEQWTQNERAEQ